jgi:hypothetical protein
MEKNIDRKSESFNLNTLTNFNLTYLLDIYYNETKCLCFVLKQISDTFLFQFENQPILNRFI